MDGQKRLSGTYAYWGPPGTGKTTTLAAQTNKIVNRSEPRADGSGPVVICSFTRTAAAEIADPKRGVRIPSWQIGTLHSHAYRLLGSPEIAETYLDVWNERHPNLAMSKDKHPSDMDDMTTSNEYISEQAGRGDQLSAEYHILRTKMIDRTFWKAEVLNFAQKWEAFKEEGGLIDFTDMIELALADCEHAPGKPDVLIVDEAQDHGALELALCKKWGEAAGQLILGGDPWQCQPAGTMVETAKHGRVPIELLDQRVHRLVSFEAESSSVTGRGEGLPFARASRRYSGRLYCIRVGDHITYCTPEHLWTVVDHTGAIRVVETRALKPSIMVLPVEAVGEGVAWRGFSLDYCQWSGIVYSLDVERHHHYIADGIITHNCLYEWRGADPSYMKDIPEDRVKVLSQSYRVPKKVLNISMKWMRLYLSEYKDLKYEPRDCEGELHRVNSSFRDPERLIPLMLKDVDAGKSVMVCGSCGYMLVPLLAEMRKRGVPFSNPFRRKRGDWNPLAANRGVTMKRRIMAFLRRDDQTYPITLPEQQRARMWTGAELAAFGSLLKGKVVIRHGGKKYLTRLGREKELEVVSREDLQKVFTDDALIILDSLYDGKPGQTKRLMEWFKHMVLDTKRKTLHYPMTVLERRGFDALTEEPKIYIGTIHSFKGAQADSVYLFPDLSPAGNQEWESRGRKRDAVVKCFYVGMTRSREKLTFCSGAGGDAVPF